MNLPMSMTVWILLTSLVTVVAGTSEVTTAENRFGDTVPIEPAATTTTGGPVVTEEYYPSCGANLSAQCWCQPRDRLTVNCAGVSTADVNVLSIPSATQILEIRGSSQEVLKAGSFAGLTKLEHLTLTEWPNLKEIEPGALDGLPRLKYIELLQLPNLYHIGPGVLVDFPALKDIVVHYCGLKTIPDFSNFSTSEIIIDIYLDYCDIEILQSDAFNGINVHIHRLSLIGNNIAVIQHFAFRSLEVVEINLSMNPLTSLKIDAFVGTDGLQTLKLSRSKMTFLPTRGLSGIKELHIDDTYSFQTFPPVLDFKSIRTARLTYFTHCCAFSFQTEEKYHNDENFGISEHRRNSTCPTTTPPPTTTPSSMNLQNTQITQGLRKTRDCRGTRKRRSASEETEWVDVKTQPPFDPVNDNDPHIPVCDLEPGGHKPNEPTQPSPYQGQFVDDTLDPNATYTLLPDGCGPITPKDYSEVDCQPKPNPFNPCGDVLSYIFLKILIWFVSLTALLGNFVVLVVLLSYISKMTVTKFLMCNLAFADFLQGIYLLITGIVDIFTAGQYYNYAIPWQWGAGCKAIGFISIFATLIGVFTLTAITMERWYAIIHAMHLNKRLHMKMAAKIMVGGWAFALFMAMLPIFGISDYSMTSMCLPMDVTRPVDFAYILTLCSVITLAFLLVVGCYVKMYLTVRSPESCSLAHKKDATVAKRMGILVFTDFACVVPIMFFAFTAALGKPLIGVEEAKILLVIFYPINSCTNPFLYALCTKAFRRDLFMMLTKHGFCEKQAMKYKGTYSSGGRSMSHSVNHPPMTTSTSHRPSTGSVLTQCMVDWHYTGNEWHNSRSSLNSNTTPQTTPKSLPRHFNLVQTPEEEEDSVLLRNGMLPTAIGSIGSNGSAGSKESLSKKLSTVPEQHDSTNIAEYPTETTQLNPSEEIWRRREEIENSIAPIAEEEKLPFHNDYENIETIEAIVAESAHSSDTNSDHSEMPTAYRIGLSLDKCEQSRKDSRTDSGIHSTITTPDVLENSDKQFVQNANPQNNLLEVISDETRV